MRQKDTSCFLKTNIKKPYDQRLMERLTNRLQRVETLNQTILNKTQEFNHTNTND